MPQLIRSCRPVLPRSPEFAIVALLHVLGCAEIREVPVELDGDTETASSGTAAEEGSDPSGTEGQDQDTEANVDTTATATTASTSSSTEDGPETFMVCTTGSAIPDDGTWLEVTLEVPPEIAALGVTTGVRIEHPRSSELRIQLAGPGPAPPLTLLDTPPCEGAGLALFFDDAAEVPVDEQCNTTDIPALVGTVIPVQPLGPLLDGPSAGTWTLLVQDIDAGNGGYLDNWCLTFEEG